MATAGAALPDNTTFRYERVNCGKSACRRCGGERFEHGPYWYAYWETGGRKKPRMHKLYVGKAGENATPDELRAFYAKRQARKRGGTGSDTGTSGGGSAGGSTGNTSSGGASSDCFGKRRPLSDDFATIGSRQGVSFEEARRAYYEAIQREHPDKGGSVEQAKCINAAWDRIKRFYGRR